MIIDYLSDQLGCGCAQKLSDPVSRPMAIAGAARPVTPYANEYVPPMVESPTQTPLYKAARRCPRSIERGDVNVNVNVSNTQGGAASESTGASAPRTDKPSSSPRSTDPIDKRDVEDAVRKVISERPAFESTPSVQSKPVVEYKPFAVPQDRVVTKTVYKPVNIVWDRIKKTFINRDVNHPIDRVRKVPQPAVRASFEGPKRQ